MAVAAYKKVQAGIEPVPGTAVAATARLAGITVTMDMADQMVEEPEDQRGSLARHTRSFATATEVKLKASGNASFEDLIFFAGLTLVDTTPVTSGIKQTWTFEPALDAANSPKTATFEVGDDTQAYEVEHVFGTGLKLSGAIDKAIKVDSDLVGKKWTETTFTDPVSDREIEEILWNLTEMYVDDPAVHAIGTTRVSQFLIDGSWDTGDHFMPKKRADGDLAYRGVSEKSLMPVLEVTAEFNTDAQVLMTAYRNRLTHGAQTHVLVRLVATGSTFTGGTKTMIIDGAYEVFSVGTIDSGNDGSSTMKFTLHGVEDEDYGKLFQLVLINTCSDYLAVPA